MKRRSLQLVAGLAAAALALGSLLALVSLRDSKPIAAQLDNDEPLGLAVMTTIGAELVEVEAISTDAAFTVVIDNIDTGQQDTAVELTAHGSYGLRTFTTVAVDGRANFTIQSADHAESGVTLLVARSGDRIGWDDVTLVPGQAVDPVESMLGARTIVANGSDHTMVVSIPVDTQGNPVPDGTPVNWTLTRTGAPEDGLPFPTETLSAQTDHLLAFKRIFAATTAGTSKVGPIVDGAHGREASFIEVPGVPVAFGLQLLDPQTPADGRSLVRIRTDELVDQFGNVMLDGTRVSLDVLGIPTSGTEQTTSRLWGSSQQGRAQFVLQAPSGATRLQLTAWASGQASTPLEVVFTTAVADIDVRVADTDEGTEVQIGPVLTVRDTYVTNGTEATVTALANDVEIASTGVVLDDGSASLMVPVETDLVRVTVLGHTTEVAVTR